MINDTWKRAWQPFLRDENKCVKCAEEFSEDNVFTLNGRLETQISGMCEVCFDGLFEGEDDGDNC